jgi:hypothetical protein
MIFMQHRWSRYAKQFRDPRSSWQTTVNQKLSLIARHLVGGCFGRILAMVALGAQELTQVCEMSHFGAAPMNRSRHFETALREASVISAMLDDLGRTIQILDVDIAAEEERARVFDCSNARYPILAKTLAARRDNLKGTILELEDRLATVRARLAMPVAA